MILQQMKLLLFHQIYLLMKMTYIYRLERRNKEIGEAEAEKTLVYCFYAGYFNCDYDMLILRK